VFSFSQGIRGRGHVGEPASAAAPSGDNAELCDFALEFSNIQNNKQPQPIVVRSSRKLLQQFGC